MVIEGYWYTNIGSRSENEDSCAYFSPGPDQYCAVICDGLGGHGGGKAASSIGVKALSQWQADEALPSGETILAWMNEANRNILATRANANQMKTTAVALYLYKNQAVWAHIGDSRLYHFHNGVLADYTEDHSLAQLSIKMGPSFTHPSRFPPETMRFCCAPTVSGSGCWRTRSCSTFTRPPRRRNGYICSAAAP